VKNPALGEPNICSIAAGSLLRKARSQPERLLIGDLRVDYNENDVGEFCKYPFPDKLEEPYDVDWPVGAPPFFHERPRAAR